MSCLVNCVLKKGALQWDDYNSKDDNIKKC